MKYLKLIAIALLAIGFTACGDEKEDDGPTIPTTGTITYEGILNTTASGIAYATDETSAQLIWTGEGTARLVIAQMTARPATETAPASIMNDFTVENIKVEMQDNGTYALSTDNFQGGGTMNGRYSAFVLGDINGTIKGKELNVTVDYKFTQSPYEPQLSSVFTGTQK